MESSSYLGRSRGYLTKGAKYKERYVENQCPECGNARSYEDKWHTGTNYTCLKRSCRHQWFVSKKKQEELRNLYPEDME